MPPEAKGPRAANKVLWFLHKKILILAHFFIEKGHAQSAVTMDNAKIFSQSCSLRLKADAWLKYAKRGCNHY